MSISQGATARGAHAPARARTERRLEVGVHHGAAVNLLRHRQVHPAEARARVGLSAGSPSCGSAAASRHAPVQLVAGAVLLARADVQEDVALVVDERLRARGSNGSSVARAPCSWRQLGGGCGPRLAAAASSCGADCSWVVAARKCAARAHVDLLRLHHLPLRGISGDCERRARASRHRAARAGDGARVSGARRQAQPRTRAARWSDSFRSDAHHRRGEGCACERRRRQNSDQAAAQRCRAP